MGNTSITDPRYPSRQLFVNLDGSINTSVSNSAQSGYVALTTPPAATTAATDTTFTFSSQVNNIVIQNNTNAGLNVAFDTTATAGSLYLAPGQYLEKAKKVTAVHLLTTLAANVNGTSASNIVLLGEL